jgi:hypothetical protein
MARGPLQSSRETASRPPSEGPLRGCQQNGFVIYYAETRKSVRRRLRYANTQSGAVLIVVVAIISLTVAASRARESIRRSRS